MTFGPVTARYGLKEPGGTVTVITPTWTVCIIMAHTHPTLMVSTGIAGKDITIPPRELRWKSDQWSFDTFCDIFPDDCWSIQIMTTESWEKKMLKQLAD